MTENIPHIRKISKVFFWVFSVGMLALPLYYLIYWMGFNHWHHTLFTVNVQDKLLESEPLYPLQQILGVVSSLLVVLPGLYGLYFVRQLFVLYKSGSIFSGKHVCCLKHTGQALIAWVLLGVVYGSIESVLLSAGNLSGQHVLSVTVSGNDVLLLIIAFVIRLLSWVMKEALVIAEENQLTI